MSLRMPAPKEVQPKSFKFNKANLDKINSIISKYPSEADDNPFPSDETTPPVTNIYRAMELCYSQRIKKIKVLIVIFRNFWCIICIFLDFIDYRCRWS